MFWRPYVSVAERRRKALREMEKLKKKGLRVQPVEIEGRTIARSFWGKGWCEHLESFSDYSNRLPRGRTYVRNGSVCHLEITPGRIEAKVCGNDLYSVSIDIRSLNDTFWKNIQKKCAGRIGSMLELLQGKLSNQVMAIVTNREAGLFPRPGEIKLTCSCPDWATMCKHVAAVLYGVGSRLDERPDLLFVLRKVDPQELISTPIAIPGGAVVPGNHLLSEDDLSGIFGVDIETEITSAPQKPAQRKKAPASSPKQKKETARVARAAKTASSKDKFEATGDFIRRMRSRLNLSTEDFAKLLGVSPATVERWESTAGPLTLRSRPLRSLTDLHRKMERMEAKEKR